ncbi:GDSL-type esterase/lipase family protein [Leifsonia sp. C5G2]|uniref:GDSL-type esterase/lipase family protein n=1 Tax=Leifsonia sp. C5G2 TaxID=2735269 RepID=UPI0015852A51|nr:GAF domain-containing protein [Leifsonia sp. C5G2]
MDDERVSLLSRSAMRLWLVHVATVRSRLVRPLDGRQAYVAGRRPLRVLLVGSGPVMGWGVGSYDLALPGAMARALAASTGRGAVVDVVPHPSAGVRRLRRLVHAAEPGRYDAVVLSGAVADAVRMAEPKGWRTRLHALLAQTVSAGTRTVVWLGAQPIRSIPSFDSRPGQAAQDHAERLNGIAREVCGEAGAVFVPLSGPPPGAAGRHRTPSDYLHWAREIVDALIPALQERVAPNPAASEGSDRAQAIARLKLGSRGGDARLDGIVGTAKRTLGTEIAMFTVLDDVKAWPLASAGAVLDEIPIEQSACIHTIRTPDGMVVPNAIEDPRFAGSALVAGPAGLRYYAGYPVEAPDGTRIGAICVFGRTPRERADGEADLDVLRELALLAQRELWRFAPAADD